VSRVRGGDSVREGGEGGTGGAAVDGPGAAVSVACALSEDEGSSDVPEFIKRNPEPSATTAAKPRIKGSFDERRNWRPSISSSSAAREAGTAGIRAVAAMPGARAIAGAGSDAGAITGAAEGSDAGAITGAAAGSDAGAITGAGALLGAASLGVAPGGNDPADGATASAGGIPGDTKGAAEAVRGA
jgi:hypothetical protein